MKRALLLIVSMLLFLPAWATISTGQAVKCTGSTTTNACTSGTTCAISGLTAIGAGHALVGVSISDGTGGAATALSISSINGETWTHCTGCSSVSGTTEVDASYVLSATGGETSFTFTMSGTIVGMNVCIVELTTTTSGFAFDNACKSAVTSAAPTTCALASITGTNDVKIGAFVWGGSLTGVSAPGSNFVAPNSNGIALVLNVATLTGISFTPTSANSGPDFMFALKEVASSAPKCTIALTGAGPC